jgi:hypothetical protein
MFWSIFSNVKVMIFTAITVVVLATLAYIWYLRSTVDTLRQDNAKLQVAVQEQTKTIEALQKDYKAIIAAKDAYNEKVKQLEKKTKDLEDKLWREHEGKLSIEELALLDKKDRIEKVINNATQKVLDCFKALSGDTSVKCLR